MVTSDAIASCHFWSGYTQGQSGGSRLSQRASSPPPALSMPLSLALAPVGLQGHLMCTGHIPPQKVGLPVLRLQQTSPLFLLFRTEACAHLAAREAGRQTLASSLWGSEHWPGHQGLL